MEPDLIVELLPRYIAGGLDEKDSLMVSRALAEDPGLLRELRLALALREELLESTPEPPPFPAAVTRQAQQTGFIPVTLKDSLRTLRQAADITGNALKLAFKLSR